MGRVSTRGPVQDRALSRVNIPLSFMLKVKPKVNLAFPEPVEGDKECMCVVGVLLQLVLAKLRQNESGNIYRCKTDLEGLRLHSIQEKSVVGLVPFWQPQNSLDSFPVGANAL